MARRRFQTGSLIPSKGLPKDGIWRGRWREDVIMPDGTIKREYLWEIIGTIEEYPTRALAKRALADRLSTVNSPLYRARPRATFAGFVRRWETNTLTQTARSFQASERSRLHAHLLPALGHLQLTEINSGHVQALIAEMQIEPKGCKRKRCGHSREAHRKGKGRCRAAEGTPCDCGQYLGAVGAKTVHNTIGTLRLVWNTAVADGYLSPEQDWFRGLRLPSVPKADVPLFTEDEMREIINAASGLYRTFYWLLAETGARLGEGCSLQVKRLHLDIPAVEVRTSAWHGHVGNTKADKPRIFNISPQLAQELRAAIEPIKDNPEAFIFATAKRKPWIGDDVVKKHLKPLLEELGIKVNVPDVGAHAFRHGNTSIMDRLGTPTKVRQDRLGHVDFERITLGVYTHSASEDHQAVARQLGTILAPQPSAAEDSAR